MLNFVPKINADYLAIAKSPRDKRRKPAALKKQHHVKDLQSRARMVIRLKHEGLLSNKQIAEMVGVTPQTVSNLANSELALEHLAAMDEAADTGVVCTSQRLNEIARKANSFLESAMDGNEGADIKTRVQIASDYMARAGFAPVTRSQNLTPSHFSQKDMNEAKARAVAAQAELQPTPENVVKLQANS